METDVAKIVDNLPSILGGGIIIHVKKGTPVFNKGDVTTHAYFVIEGDLIVQNPHSSGETYLISHIGQGSFMCDLEIISGNLINTTTLITSTDCTLLKFSSELFLTALRHDIEFLFMVSKKMADKMYQESYRLGDDLYKNGVDKLKVYLIKSFKEQSVDDNLIIYKTRQVISHEVGISIKTINRSVKKLKEQERLSISVGKIHLNKKHYELLISDLAC